MLSSTVGGEREAPGSGRLFIGARVGPPHPCERGLDDCGKRVVSSPVKERSLGIGLLAVRLDACDRISRGREPVTGTPVWEWPETGLGPADVGIGTLGSSSTLLDPLAERKRPSRACLSLSRALFISFHSSSAA